MKRLIAVLGLALLAFLAWAADDTSWLTYGGNYSGWRYSELTQVNAGNVARLTPKWMFQTKVPGNTQATPIVRDGMIYHRAVEQRVGTRPSHRPPALAILEDAPRGRSGLCCGEVNRGFAILGNRLFKVNIEDVLVALDISTGKVLWETVLADHKKGYSGTVAPLIVKDKILVGTAGAEWGILGFPSRPITTLASGLRRSHWNRVTGAERATQRSRRRVPKPGSPASPSEADSVIGHRICAPT